MYLRVLDVNVGGIEWVSNRVEEGGDHTLPTKKERGTTDWTNLFLRPSDPLWSK